eukprot:5359689-Ditylum_brightwellii.AAC.1
MKNPCCKHDGAHEWDNCPDNFQNKKKDDKKKNKTKDKDKDDDKQNQINKESKCSNSLGKDYNLSKEEEA